VIIFFVHSERDYTYSLFVVVSQAAR